MSEPIHILVATMSGTAEMVGDEVAAHLKQRGRDTHVVRMEKASRAMLELGGAFLICSSTYGTGDVPDNGRGLYESLRAESANLARVRYGVIALGDTTYSATFCFGGRQFDELFASLGAKRVGERLQHDSKSSTYPEDAALAWLAEWLAILDGNEPHETH
jgi:MioC protein